MNDDFWKIVIELTKKLGIGVRLCTKTDGATKMWSSWLVEPSPSYVEANGSGPIRKQDIVWIEIDPIEKRKLGRLLPKENIDHSDDIASRLKDAGVSFSKVEDVLIRININQEN